LTSAENSGGVFDSRTDRSPEQLVEHPLSPAFDSRKLASASGAGKIRASSRYKMLRDTRRGRVFCRWPQKKREDSEAGMRPRRAQLRAPEPIAGTALMLSSELRSLGAS